MKLLDLEPRYFLRVLGDDKIGCMSGDGAPALFPQLFKLFSVFFQVHVGTFRGGRITTRPIILLTIQFF